MESRLPYWNKNLYAVIIAELVVVAAFSFPNPFMPLFIRRLGGLNDEQAALWSGIAIGVTGIAMFISAPLWGMVADRFGRKRMLLRGMLGGFLVLALQGAVPNVYVFVVLRFLQGLLAGTVPAAASLISAGTPHSRVPFAIGLLMVAMYVGFSIGPFIGGYMGHSLGYELTFYVAGILVLMGGIAVLFVVKEEFVPPPRGQGASLRSMLSLARSPPMLPLLITQCVLGAGPQVIAPIVPLSIAQMDVTGTASVSAGVALGLMGGFSGISAVVAGRLGSRAASKRAIIIVAGATGLLYLPPIWATSAWQFVILVALSGLPQGALMASATTMIGLSAPRSQQGVAYGVSQSAMALGGGIGPFMGGSLAPAIGLNPVFAVTSGLFFAISIAVARFMREHKPVDPEIAVGKSRCD